MSKRTFKKPKRIQFIYFLLIFLSGGSLFFIKNQPDEEQNIWLMLVLLLVLMYSLMKSTQNWAYDNPKPDPDEEKNKPVYKDRDIPSLEDMIKKHKKDQ